MIVMPPVIVVPSVTLQPPEFFVFRLKKRLRVKLLTLPEQFASLV